MCRFEQVHCYIEKHCHVAWRRQFWKFRQEESVFKILAHVRDVIDTQDESGTVFNLVKLAKPDSFCSTQGSVQIVTIVT